jgi:hypothetical protein
VSTLTQLKLGFATLGLLVWAYGYRVDDSMLRLIGIVFLAIAVGLRFVKPRSRDENAT